MDRTIESIWNRGFFKADENTMNKLNTFFDRKSMDYVEQTLRRLEKELKFLLVAAILVIFINGVAGNSLSWGVFSAFLVLPWYFLGKYQIKILRRIEYDVDCYTYLKSLSRKLNKISRFNQQLTIIYTTIILLPMLIYTYYNNIDKSFGEIFGVNTLPWSNRLIFIFLPVILIFAYGLTEWLIRKSNNPNHSKIHALIRDMEELMMAD